MVKASFFAGAVQYDLDEATVFEVSGESPAGASACGYGNCAIRKRLTFRSKGCIGSLYCPLLKEAPCSEFGLVLTTTSSDGSSKVTRQQDNVCRENVRHPVKLYGASASLQVDLWFFPLSRVRVRCFLWCTAEGEVPAAKVDTAAVSPHKILLNLLLSD